MTQLEAAIALAEMGIKIFPTDKDKRPRVGTWKENASSDIEQIVTWWTNWPNALIAIKTGADSNLTVLDLDVEKDKVTKQVVLYDGKPNYLGVKNLAATGRVSRQTMQDWRSANLGSGPINCLDAGLSS